MQEMYKAKINSPMTTLASDITIDQTTIPLVDASVLPDPPNICTIGTDDIAETIVYTGKNVNQLTGVTRGFQGVAKAWLATSPVGRYYTAYDHDAFVGNIQEIGSKVDSTTNELKTHKADYTKSVAKVVSVEAFGAKGDGVTYDTQALLDTKAYVLANGGIFYVPETFNCLVSGDIDLFGIKDIRIEGTITGTLATDELIIGYYATQVVPTNYFINQVDTMKIKLQGIKNGKTTINKAAHVLLWADGDNPKIYSIAYSKFTLGYIGKLEFNSQGTGTNYGWINENKFYGGRFSELIMDGNYFHNNNIFYNPTIEGTSININKGSSNWFYDCRGEGANSIIFGVGTHNNVIMFSMVSAWSTYLRDSLGIDSFVTDNGQGNYVLYNNDMFFNKKVIYDINPTTNNIDLTVFKRNQSSLSLKKDWTRIFETDIIPLNKPMGFLFQSTGKYFRPTVYVYDENKDPITTEPLNVVDMVGGTWNPVGLFSLGADQTDHGVAIVPHPTVKYIKYTVETGGAVGDIDYLRIAMIESNRSIQPIPILSNKVMCSSAMPTEGYFYAGDYVKNNTPTLVGTTPNKYIIKGWIRLTTGDTHVAGTDWVEDRTGATGL